MMRVRVATDVRGGLETNLKTSPAGMVPARSIGGASHQQYGMTTAFAKGKLVATAQLEENSGRTMLLAHLSENLNLERTSTTSF